KEFLLVISVLNFALTVEIRMQRIYHGEWEREFLRQETNMDIKERLSRRIDAALGKIPCDLVFKGLNTLDVFSGSWKSTDVGIIDGTVVVTDPGVKSKREIDSQKHFGVPGFIDAHVHVESSLLIPGNFERVTLPKGTTTAICD